MKTQKDESEYFNELKLLVKNYLAARYKLLKYELYEKSASLAASILSSLTIMLLFFFTLFFISVAGGFYLGQLYDNYALGFLWVAGVYMALLVMVILFRKWLSEKMIADGIIRHLTKNERIQPEAGEDELLSESGE